jgi:hypothetical protein
MLPLNNVVPRHGTKFSLVLLISHKYVLKNLDAIINQLQLIFHIRVERLTSLAVCFSP